MDTNKNSYTLTFSIILIVVVAGLLSWVATQLKPFQAANVSQEKMQNILKTIGMDLTRAESAVQFETYVKQQLALNENGEADANVDAFKINLKKEVKKDAAEQRFPLFIAEKDGKKFYVIPLQGNGLWDIIWGYIALEEDFNTIYGAIFDHKGETPGLGAEISKDFYEQQYKGKRLFDGATFKSVKAVKGGGTANKPHEVDAISGGTITSDGVSNMIAERVQRYIPYIEKVRASQEAAKAEMTQEAQEVVMNETEKSNAN